MDVLTLNGKRYVKASRAAKDLGYASDYVGQLCRNGSVDAHLVGRTWYVNPDTLGAHRIEKKRTSRTKARIFAKKAIDETRALQVAQTEKSYKNIAIHYNTDASGLIPEVKKIGIVSDIKKEVLPQIDADESPYTLVNAEKKVLMSGTIRVKDAEEEVQYTDVTILTPKILHKKPQIPRKERLPEGEEGDDAQTVRTEASPSTDEDSTVTPMRFIDRLEAVEDNASPVETKTVPGSEQLSVGNHRNTLILIAQVTSSIVLIVSACAFFLEERLQYTYPNTSSTSITFTLNIIKDFVEKY